MKHNILIILISLSICKYLLYVDEMHILNDKKNFLIILDISGLNNSTKIIANNIFNIVLDSENYQEKNVKIKFICNLFYLNNFNSQIKCLLEEKISSNIIGPFSFRQEYLKKSFIIKINDKYFKFTLDILEEVFYIGILKSFRTKKNNVKIDYKISYIIIPIAMALNNEYLYPTIVSITSILKNANYYTKYDFYILHNPIFSSKNKIILKTFEIKYYNKCSINLINIKNFKFKNAWLSGHIKTIVAYYRLIISDLLPNIDKIIYLDSDTLIFKDLKEMYDINMDNYYYKGFLDVSKDPLLSKNDNYICSGVLLINLENIRKNNIVNKMYEYMIKIKNNKNLVFHDQTIINGVCSEKIGILPPKFGIFNFINLDLLFILTKNAYKDKKYRYSDEELKDAYLNPSILHCVQKPWGREKNIYGKKIWINYAKETGYYKKIKKIYKLRK